MITVIGCDSGPLGEAAREALAAAGCVAGARRHLDALPVPGGARRIELGPLQPALDELARRPDDAEEPAVVLASGDPGFFGVVRALRARGAVPRVVPAASSVAVAFAQLGLPWDDALVVSAHGRDPRPALAAALAHPKTAILTAPGVGPEAFASRLVEAGRAVYVAERLGDPRERIEPVTAPGPLEPDEYAHPNVVLAVDGAAGRHAGQPPAPGWLAGHQGAPDGWALAEDTFAHRDSMVTKSEVRALALARLAPRPGVVIWDVGAGSGAVAVECARFGAYVLAFERDRDQCARVRENAAACGVHVGVVEGAAPGSLAGQLPPDAVFLGGGGEDVMTGTVARANASRVVGALASLDRVGALRATLAGAGYAVDGTVLQASRLAELPGGSVRLSASNPVFVLWGRR